MVPTIPKRPKEEDGVIGAPSVSTSKLYPSDQYLRRHGFSIHSRPNKGLALWSRKSAKTGVVWVMTEEEALALVARELKALENNKT